MDTKTLQEIIAWVRGTDLTEVSYRRGAVSLEFRIEGAAPASPETAFPASALVPVVSPGVGLFRFNAPGSPRRAQEGRDVAQGEALGSLETGGAPVEVTAPAHGRLLKVLVEEGKAVEYGQALFLISPSGAPSAA